MSYIHHLTDNPRPLVYTHLSLTGIFFGYHSIVVTVVAVGGGCRVFVHNDQLDCYRCNRRLWQVNMERQASQSPRLRQANSLGKGFIRRPTLAAGPNKIKGFGSQVATPSAASCLCV